MLSRKEDKDLAQLIVIILPNASFIFSLFISMVGNIFDCAKSLQCRDNYDVLHTNLNENLLHVTSGKLETEVVLYTQNITEVARQQICLWIRDSLVL